VLRRQLARVREDGVALEREESGVGVVCAASPLLDARGVAVAAVSISGWANRMRTERVAPAVRTVALALTRTLSGATADSRNNLARQRFPPG
jgi:IclR family transcriptional regulator, acetate operon repressor